MAAKHTELERLIKAAGLMYTFIRPGMFATNVVRWWASQIRSGNVVRWPYAAAATAPIEERDIARVLTGPESLTHADQLRVIGEALARSKNCRLKNSAERPQAHRRHSLSTAMRGTPPSVCPCV